MSDSCHTYDNRQLNLRNQHGAAFIVMLVIMVLGVTTVLVGSLSSAGLKIERDVKTAEALAQAKDALIGLAVIYNDYPGSLPCPDTDNDGSSNAIGGLPTECPQYIGRLPWKTLGLPDLRDAVGERLWYTLSANVRRYDSVRPLNSDTTGTLNVTGTNTANNLVAIVFAPGSTIGTQSRSDSNAFCTTTGDTRKESLCAANYLEGSNANPSPGSSPNQNYQNANTSVQFNDQLITISHDQLFSKVEKRVGAEIKNILNTYYAAWGAFPFAAPFADPSASTFTGQASPATYEGLLPIGDNVIPVWAGIPAVTFSGGGSYNYCELRNGSVSNSRWRCYDISISPGETITITGTLNNVGRGLWRPHNVNNICEVRARNIIGTNVLATSVLNNVTVTGYLNANGSATITFQAKGKSGYPTLQRIELRDILDYTTDIKSNPNTASCTPTSGSPTIPTWLFDDTIAGNDWHKVAYYAVAEEYAPGGDHTCTTSPCLTVNGQNGGNDKRALITMAGRAIAGAHPSGVLSDYLEGENQTTGDHIFENQTRSATFNDQIIIIAP
jgi:hypothetical protein